MFAIKQGVFAAQQASSFTSVEVSLFHFEREKYFQQSLSSSVNENWRLMAARSIYSLQPLKFTPKTLHG